ncbi:hypothetical protein HDU84_009366 [Entophlyctis sp. JEL0112]|nr:hypothetical protein HDU84_009366 [Entophlyctis sp. JEL0112]
MIPVRKNRILLPAVAIAVIMAIVALRQFGAVDAIKAFLISLLSYIDRHKSYGAILFIILFMIMTVMMLPASLATMAAGVIFKPVIFAIALVLIGSQLGLIACLVLGKTVLRPWVEQYKKQSPFLKSLDGALAREGFKIVVLIRVSPVLPFGIANYLFSITSIPTPLLQFATFIGNIPGAVAYAVLGSYIGSLSGIAGDDDDDKKPQFSNRVKAFAALGSGCLLVWTVVYMGIFARGALRLATARSAEEEAVLTADDIVESEGEVEDRNEGAPNRVSASAVGGSEILPVSSPAGTARRSVDLESGRLSAENRHSGDGAGNSREGSGAERERAPLIVEDERSGGGDRRRVRSLDTPSLQMSVSDELGESVFDANGYTSSDRQLLERTLWGLSAIFVIGSIVILFLVK